MILLTENQCFPCVSYIKLLADNKHIKLEAYENFKKTSFRNRYVIAGANGLINLTIPVVGGREQRVVFRDVQIDHSSNWQTRHWRSIASSYRKAPFFDYYSEAVKDLVFNPEKKLFHFNVSILANVCKLLNINAYIDFTELFSAPYEQVPGTLDFRNKFLPANFQKEGNYYSVKYSQVFEDRIGFQPNLSILDLLFCSGPHASTLLTA